MHHTVRLRPVRLADEANMPFLRVAVVRALQIGTIEIDVVEAIVIEPKGCLTYSSSALHPLPASERATEPPRIRLLRRILSP
jgi:hypothetical protein